MFSLKRWTDKVPSGLSTDLYKDFALKHARLAGEQGKIVHRLIVKNQFADICAFKVDYLSGASPTEMYHLRQALAFFSKLEYLEIGIDKEAAAMSTFLESEALCRETNECFRSWSRGEFKFFPRVDSVLSDAARKIAQVLGPVPRLDKLGLRFGPGATALTIKRKASPRQKFSDGLACSEDLLPELSKVLLELPIWTTAYNTYHYVDGGPLVVSGDCSILKEEYYAVIEVSVDASSVEVYYGAELLVNLCDETLAFVPKNARTFRSVSTPSPLNSMVQLGYGDHIKKRLKRFGIDLSDQTINQRLAKEGSLTGVLATLDLSSASDTISHGIVLHLLPIDWVKALSACRSSFIRFRGERRMLEKYASMGNGYTFPLESLIFWALATASCDPGDVVSVYGDDIIMPGRHVPLFREVLVACGFKLNLEKSYSTGPFRESCGSDWYRGFNIRPFYAKSEVSGEVLFSLHNYYARNGLDDFCGDVLKRIPEEMRLYGPDGLGDGVLLGTWVPGQRKPRQERDGYSGSLVKMHKHIGLRERCEASEFDRVQALYAVDRRAIERFVEKLPPFGVRNFGENYLHRQFLASCGTPPVEIPFLEKSGSSGLNVKAASVPGTDGSHSVLVYSFKSV